MTQNVYARDALNRARDADVRVDALFPYRTRVRYERGSGVLRRSIGRWLSENGGSGEYVVHRANEDASDTFDDDYLFTDPAGALALRLQYGMILRGGNDSTEICEDGWPEASDGLLHHL